MDASLAGGGGCFSLCRSLVKATRLQTWCSSAASEDTSGRQSPGPVCCALCGKGESVTSFSCLQWDLFIYLIN